MVTLRAHGGSCCGAQHIAGFSSNQAQEIDELYRLTQQRDPCLHEVILNRDQCRGYPQVLAKLAELGYVLTTGFVNGNHDSSVYVFHRAGRRLPLNNLDFDWAGQIASPSLRGDLPRLPEPVNGGRDRRPPFHPRGSTVQPEDIRRGDVFIYHNERNPLNGASLEYTSRFAPGRYDYEIILLHRATGRQVKRAISNLRWYSQAAYPDGERQTQAIQAIPLQRHQQDEAALDEVVREHIVVEQPLRRIVHTTYHNVFRDGRVGPGYPTLEAAQNGAPRALNRQIQHVYSDGTTETVDAG